MTEAFYFGEPWPSGICEDGFRVGIPLGQSCLFCEEEIRVGDQGSFMGDVTENGKASLRPVHRECSLRSVLGSYAHLTMGEHPVGACNDVDLGLTKREDALKVWEWVQENGVPT